MLLKISLGFLTIAIKSYDKINSELYFQMNKSQVIVDFNQGAYKSKDPLCEIDFVMIHNVCGINNIRTSVAS